jgi:hypothetical protein
VVNPVKARLEWLEERETNLAQSDFPKAHGG